MEIHHPEALDDVGGECPSRVRLGGERRDCADGSAFEASEAQAEALAERYGVDVASIRVEDEAASDPADGDICGAEMSDGSTCERPADDCPYHS